MKKPTLKQFGTALVTLMAPENDCTDNRAVAEWLMELCCTDCGRLEARLDGATVAEATRFRHQPNPVELARILDNF